MTKWHAWMELDKDRMMLHGLIFLEPGKRPEPYGSHWMRVPSLDIDPTAQNSAPRDE